MKNNINITVVIPAYSKPELLLRTLKSVYDQKGDYLIDVIVIDDNSPKALKPIIEKFFPQVKVIRNNKNLKPGLARNRALNFIDSEYVSFLDSDDIWEKDFLSESIKNLLGEKSIGTVAMSSPLFDKDVSLVFRLKIFLLSSIRNFFQILFYIFNCKVMPKSAFYLCQLSHILFKTEKIKGLSFDANYRFGEDWKFILEVMNRGDLMIVPKKMVRYRYHINSYSQQNGSLKNKSSFYKRLLEESNNYKVKGIMVWLFKKYIQTL